MSSTASPLPTRSSEGKAALDIFYAGFNDINFYVEDIEQENLYEHILKRLFPAVRICRVFPLGGKQQVIKHATSELNTGITAFRAYILDRDFDSFLGKTCSLPNVFYHGRFCIENHFLEPTALIEIAVENNPRKKRSEIETKLSIESQIASTFQTLRPLFVLFYFAQKLELGVKNCSCPPEMFCRARQLGQLDEASVSRYESEIVAAAQIAQISPPLEKAHGDPRAGRIDRAPDHQAISGKFVAAMLFHYVKSQYSLGSMTFDSFVYRLAKNCNLASMRYFAARVRRAAAAHRAGSGRDVRVSGASRESRTTHEKR